MAFNKKLKAWVRYDGKNRVVAGSLILQPNQPKVGKWKELPVYKCCNTSTCIDLPLFLSRMNSCYEQATILVPRIVYFTDEPNNSLLGPFTLIINGCDDMYDSGNLYNTNLTQLYVDIAEDNVDYNLSIPYTHTQDDNDSNCSYTNPPMDGTIVNGSSYFGSGSTYFTNMYPGMFITAATCVNVTEFSITGNIGTDGGGIDAAYIQTAHPGWTAFIKTNYDNDDEDPSINHIILVYGDVSEATQLYDNTGEYDDHCVQGLGPQNNTIITAVVATETGTPALTEEEALAIANRILDVYENPCV